MICHACNNAAHGGCPPGSAIERGTNAEGPGSEERNKQTTGPLDPTYKHAYTDIKKLDLWTQLINMEGAEIKTSF